MQHFRSKQSKPLTLLLLISISGSFSMVKGQQQAVDPYAVNSATVIQQSPQRTASQVEESECALVMSEAVCPEVWSPVCGSDNVTYWNCCLFKAYSNVTGYVDGECESAAFVVQSEGNLTLSATEQDDDVPLTEEPVGNTIRKLLDNLGNVLVVDEYYGSDPQQPAPPSPSPPTLPASTSSGDINLEPVYPLYLIQEDNPNLPVFEAVIGEDDLRTINTTTVYPFHAIGRFTKVGCTGFVIGDNLVLTSAHCIFDTRVGDFFQGLEFTPGQNGPGSAPFGNLRWNFAFIPWQFQEELDLAYDFGLVVLADSFTEACSNAGIDNCGFMEYSTECLDRNYTLNIAGYRNDVKEAGFQDRMWVSPCSNVQIPCEISTFPHKCDTTAGMAGAPLWVYRRTPDGQGVRHVVRGIHIGQDTSGQKVNTGVSLTQENIDKINEWVVRAEELLQQQSG